MQEIGILGSGAQADELVSYVPSQTSCAFRALSPAYFTGAEGTINTAEADEHVHTPVIAAIGAPAGRRAMVDEWPGDQYATVVSEGAYVDPSSRVGEGSIIARSAVITTNVVIGRHALINVGVTISHDCEFGDFVTVSPGVHIAGHVRLGDGVFVGIGATISNDISIAAGCVIGAGAMVLESVAEENTVLVGNPARAIRQNDGWLDAI